MAVVMELGTELVMELLMELGTELAMAVWEVDTEGLAVLHQLVQEDSMAVSTQVLTAVQRTAQLTVRHTAQHTARRTAQLTEDMNVHRRHHHTDTNQHRTPRLLHRRGRGLADCPTHLPIKLLPMQGTSTPRRHQACIREVSSPCVQEDLPMETFRLHHR